MLLLKRVMMAKLAEAGCELPIQPPVRGIDREIVRFNRALERACEKQLIGIREIGAVTYLWLQFAQPDENEF
jgi:hypothetical protein